jgi:hypothetical protein
MNPNMLNPKTSTEIRNNGFCLEGHTRRQYAFADMAGSSWSLALPKTMDLLFFVPFLWFLALLCR